METQRILGVKFNILDQAGFIRKIDQELSGDSYDSKYVVTPNAEIVMQARKDPRLNEIIDSAWLSSPDGSGILMASKLLPEKRIFQERVAGFDLMEALIELAAERNYSVYFLGGRPGIVEKARDNLMRSYPGIDICGCHHGYLDARLKVEVIADINQQRPDLLLVGMGAPRQEYFISEHKDELDFKVALTVGGSFDVISGEKKRAPGWVQKIYLEWLYRLFQEPARWKRIKVLPHFILIMLIDGIKN
ncbi:WecB/TagA/CpsF family glycosyltransferase [Halanaerobiaceae bacterium Z-7014]|uniref:WecB/TagA/CpsF family glycosyltransferase n=1 Tax=Halonatronomonas betaini TaxID=2778430 RepID=A0A931F5C3_9FIRM|nr:WecB/TagA/CpsF family glycosyltransferase [Halonatronomonas betaini]MBF8435730.1 WecB/TagA/CpsF family glycosyltransferase [Halonatronomonas betaini]